MFAGKGMQDMLANLATRVLGMTPEQIRAKIEETGAMIKGTLAHFDQRLAALERETAAMRSQLERINGYGEKDKAGYGAVTGQLIPCPDFAGHVENERDGTAGPAGTPNGGNPLRQNANGMTQ